MSAPVKEVFADETTTERHVFYANLVGHTVRRERQAERQRYLLVGAASSRSDLPSPGLAGNPQTSRNVSHRLDIDSVVRWAATWQPVFDVSVPVPLVQRLKDEFSTTAASRVTEYFAGIIKGLNSTYEDVVVEDRRQRYKKVARLLREWLNEDDDYDDRVWPQLEEDLRTGGLQFSDGGE